MKRSHAVVGTLFVGVVAFAWPRVDTALPEVQPQIGPKEDAETGKLLSVSRDGTNVEGRVPSQAKKNGDLEVKLESTKVTSFGSPPPQTQCYLETKLRREIASFETVGKRLQKEIEAGNEDKLDDLHRNNKELEMWMAMLDTLLRGEAILTDGAMLGGSMRGYWTPHSTLGPLYVDERTGKAIDRDQFDHKNRDTSELLRYREVTVTYPIRKSSYPTVQYHEKERKRTKDNRAIAKVVTFNSLDYLQRKERYEYSQRMLAALRAGKPWEGHEVLTQDQYWKLQAEKGVPRWLEVSARKRYIAERYKQRESSR